jgi:hypothetical protein
MAPEKDKRAGDGGEAPNRPVHLREIRTPRGPRNVLETQPGFPKPGDLTG